MKVICIDASGLYPHTPPIQEGQVYTTDGHPDNDFYHEHYCLAEIPTMCSNGYRYGYFKCRFIPVSDIDETELIRERQKQSA